MDAISWEQALIELEALDLPPVVRTALVGSERVPEVLAWLMRDPSEMFEEPHDPSAHPPGAITPLWADHTGHIVVAHRRLGSTPGFLRFLLEEGELIEEGLTFDALVVRDLVSVWERGESADSVREAARLLGFRDVERLIEGLIATPRPTFEASDAFLASFRASLP